MSEALAAPANRHNLGIALVLISTIAWGSGGLFVRLLPFDIWTIVFWRGVFATLLIGGIVVWRFRGRTFGIIRAMGRTGVVAMLCSTATITVFVAAFQHTTIAKAMTIYAAAPFVTAAIAWLWLGERPSRATLVASAVALVGVVVMVGPTTGGPNLGDALALIGTSAMALMTVAIRRDPHVEMQPVAALATLLSTVVALPLAAHLGDLAPRDYAVAAGFGLVPMTLGMMLYVVGSALIPASLSALIGTLEAPIGAGWAWIGVGEIPAIETFIGGSIVLAGVFGRLLYDQYQERRSVSG